MEKPHRKPSPRKKNRVKSALITLFLLLIAGSAGFYFGWIQFRLNADEYGIIYTKTRGWEDTVVRNGQFTWRWEALLPTNLTLHIVKSTPQTHVISKTGTLPSGEIYGSMVREGETFNWSYRIGISYRINPEVLPKLYEQGWGDEGLETIITEYKSRLEDTLVHTIGENLDSEDLQEFQKTLNNRLSTMDERVNVLNTVILDWQYPDRELYGEAKKLVIENMRKRQQVLAEIEEERLRQLDVEDARVNLLSRYGDLLTTYPVLLDFFALDINPGEYLLPSP